jgi:dihydrodipicolinate synthase/N-acetylneuraminate lyase
MKGQLRRLEQYRSLPEGLREERVRRFPGSESFLLAAMRNGGAGCISATANVNPAAIDRLYREWQKPDADCSRRR